MNTITKKERETIQKVANDAIYPDAQGLAENTEDVINLLITQFGISKERAKSHAAKAIRLAFRLDWGGARTPGPGKKMGRPKSPPRQDGRELYPVSTRLTKAEWEAIRDGSTGDERRPPLLKLVGFQVDNNQP